MARKRLSRRVTFKVTIRYTPGESSKKQNADLPRGQIRNIDRHTNSVDSCYAVSLTVSPGYNCARLLHRRV